MRDAATEQSGGVRALVAVAGPVALLAVVQAVTTAVVLVALARPVLAVSPHALITAVVLAAATAVVLAALFSTLPFAVLLPDPLMLTFMIAAFGGLAGDATTTLALVAVASAASALVSIALTHRHLFRRLDLVPLPLIAGLMGGMGLTGIAAGLALAGGRRIDLGALTDPGWSLPAATALVAGLVLFAAGTRRRRLGAAVVVLALAALAAHGLGLPSPSSNGAAWIGWALIVAPPALPDALMTVPTLLAVLVLAALRTRVAVRDLEGETGIDAAPRREFSLVGVSGLVGAVAALAPAGLAVGLSGDVAMLGRRARPTLYGLAALLLAVAASGLAARVPATVTGAYLIWLGLGAVDDWVVRTARRAGMIERLTLAGILATVLLLGPGYGLIVGAVTGAAAFALAYSRAHPVRSRFTGAGVLSTVDRAANETAHLIATGADRVVLTVRGFLFFGTADQLLGAVRDEIRAEKGPPRHLILDFGEVDGADSSAVDSFQRLLAEAEAAEVVVMLAQLGDALAEKLMPEAGAWARVARFATIDEALDAAELAALATVPEPPRDGFSALLANGIGGALAARILTAVVREVLPAGACLLRQGAVSGDLYFLEDGAASVYLELAGGAKVRVRRFGPGTMIGEIGFHLGTPRTATVTIDAPSTVLKLTRAALTRLETEDSAAAYSFHLLIAQRLCRRILDKDHLIANLMAVSRRG